MEEILLIQVCTREWETHLENRTHMFVKCLLNKHTDATVSLVFAVHKLSRF